MSAEHHAGSESQPLVTIAIPTYNRADSYLALAIQAALGQTYERLDVVVSDNASTDHTPALVRSISDPRLRYFRHERNIGANPNANYCLQQAKGDYLLLLHDDDLIDEDFVEVCMRATGYHRDVGVIRTGVRLVDADGTLLREFSNLVGELPLSDFMRGWFAGRAPMYLCNTLFNTEKLRLLGGLKSKHELMEDGVAVFQLAARYGRVDVREVKASFRRHAAQETFSARVGDWCEDAVALLELMCDLAPENAAVIRQEGMRFFTKANYARAMEIRSPAGRLRAYLTVFRKFNYQYPPSVHHLVYLLYGTPAYDGLRSLKKRFGRSRSPAR